MRYWIAGFIGMAATCASGQTLSEALDWPEGDFRLGKSAEWRVVKGSEAADGEDALVSDAGSGQMDPLELRVMGPGELRFKARLRDPQGRLNASAIGDVEFPLPTGLASGVQLSEAGEWKEYRLTLRRGPQTVRWVHTRGKFSSGATNSAWIDGVRFAEGAEETGIAEATGAGNIEWKVEQGATMEARREAAEHGGESYLVASKERGVLGDFLRAKLPAGWYSIRWKGTTALRAEGARWSDSLGDVWHVTSGYLASPGEVVWAVERGLQNGQVVMVESALAGLTSIGEVLEGAAGREWLVNNPLDAVVVGAGAAPDGKAGLLLRRGVGAQVGGVRTELRGPALVTMVRRGGVAVRWNGEVMVPAVSTPVPSTDLVRGRYLVPPGTGVLEISGQSQEMKANLVDEVVIEELAVKGIAEGADWSGAEWTVSGGTGAGGGWHGVADKTWSVDGEDCVRVGPLAGGGRLRAAWSGAGVLEYRGYAMGSQTLELQLDGVRRLTMGGGKWEQVRAEYGEGGGHVATWDYQTAADRYAMVDDFRWRPGVTSYGDAADFRGGEWLSMGNGGWGVVADAGAEGGTSLASPALVPGESAWIELRLPVRSDVTFRWKGTGPGDYEARAQGGTVVTMTGEAGWHEMTVRSETNLVRWLVTCSGVAGVAAGSVRVDAVRVVPLPVVTAGQELEAGMKEAMGDGLGAVTILGGTARLLGGAESKDGVSAVRFEGMQAVRLAVSGPFDLSFWWRSAGFASNVFEYEVEGDGRLVREGGTGWRRAVVSRSGAGPHEVVFRRLVWNGNEALDLDGLELRGYGEAGTFSGSLGGPAGVSFFCGSLGTDHAVADEAMVRSGGGASVRLGSDATPVLAKTGGGALKWWQRHTEAIAGEKFRDRVDAWYERDGSGLVQTLVDTGVSYGGWRVWLDEVVVRPELTLGERLESGNLEWTAMPAGAWVPYASGRGLSVAVGIPDALLATTVAGPGYLYMGAPNALVRLGGQEVAATASLWRELAETPQRLEIRPIAGASFVAAGNPVVVFRPEGLAEGLDVAGAGGVRLGAVTGGWVGIRGRHLAVDGEDAVVSGVLGATAQTLGFEVSGPGFLTMRRKDVTGSADVAFLLDGVSVSASSDVVAVPAGEHTVTLQATTRSNRESRLMVDMVSWRAETAVGSAKVALGMDVPGMVWRTLASAPFRSVAVPEAVGGLVAGSPRLRAGESSWVETTLSGPGYCFVRPSVVTEPATVTNVGAIGYFGNGERLTTTVLAGGDTVIRIPAGEVVMRIRVVHSFPPATTVRSAVTYRLDDFVYVADREVPPVGADEYLPVPGIRWGAVSGTGTTWRQVDGGERRGRMWICVGGGAGTTQALPLTAAAPGLLEWEGTSIPLTRPDTGYVMSPTSNGGVYSAMLTPSLERVEFRVVNSIGLTVMRNIRFRPTEMPIGAALKTEGLSWRSGGDAVWKGYDDGGPAVSHGPTGHGTTTWLETTVQGPVRLVWEGLFRAEAGDRLVVSADGRDVYSRAGGGATFLRLNEAVRVDEEGPVVVRWRFARDGAGSAGTDSFVLWNLAVTALNEAGAGAAVDLAGMTMTQGSNAGMRFVPEASPLAVRGGELLAVRPPSSVVPPPATLETWIDAAVRGPGLVSFASRDVGVTTTAAGGLLTTKPAFDLPWAISGVYGNPLDRQWIEVVEGETATLRVRSVQTTANAVTQVGLLDGLRYDPPVSMASLDREGLRWSTGGVVWKAYGDGEWRPVLSPRLQTGEAGWVEAECTGPGTLTWLAAGSGRVEVNGLVLAEAAAQAPSNLNRTLVLPRGVTRVRWTCRRVSSGTQERMALHDVRYDPGISQWSVILGDDRLVYGFGDVSRYQVATANPPGPGREYLQLVGSGSQLMDVVTPGRGRVTYFGATATGAWSQRALQSADLPVVRRLEMSRMAEFRFQREATIPLEEAVDSGCVAWGEVESGRWAGTLVAAAKEGGDVISSGAASVLEPARITGRVTGPAVLTFWMRGSGGLLVDGEECLSVPWPGAVVAFEWERIRVELAAGEHDLTWVATRLVELDGFECEGQPELLPQLPAGPRAVVTYEGAWRAGGRYPEIVEGAVAKREMAVVMGGPAVLFQQEEVPSAATYYGPVWTTESRQLVTGRGGLAARYTMTVGMKELVLSGTRLEEVTPGEALGVAVNRAVGWRGYRGGGLAFAWGRIEGDRPVLETAIGAGNLLKWSGSSTLTVRNGATGAALGTGGGAVRLRSDGVYSWSTDSISTEVWILSLKVYPLTPENDFEVWRAAAGQGAGFPTDDPDKDGLSLMSEYLSGGRALVPDVRDAVPVMVERNGLRKPGIEFTGLSDGVRYWLDRYWDSGWSILSVKMEILTHGYPYRRYLIYPDDSYSSFGSKEVLRVRGMLTPD
jgi:hypothetical protein